MDHTGPSILTSRPSNKQCINVVRIAALMHTQVLNVAKSVILSAGQAIGSYSLVLFNLPMLGDSTPAFNLNLTLDLCEKFYESVSPVGGRCPG